MGRFFAKVIIIFFLFLLAITYLSEQENTLEDQRPPNEPTIVIQSADLYNQTEEPATEAWPNKAESSNEHDSVTYQIAQFIEQSGLFLYEGIINIVTDLANII